MVLESVVADLLNRFLGDYVENLNKSQLKLGIWGGKEPLSSLAPSPRRCGAAALTGAERFLAAGSGSRWLRFPRAGSPGGGAAVSSEGRAGCGAAAPVRRARAAEPRADRPPLPHREGRSVCESVSLWLRTRLPHDCARGL